MSGSVGATTPAAGPVRSDGHAGYLFPVDNDGGTGSNAVTASSTANDAVYEDDQNRDLAFGDRMY